jgi:predicted butyrate kinase (DUF1464 family)
MARVAGTDPGTSSLDLLILDGGVVADQDRFTPEQLRADPNLPVRWLNEREPFDLIAGPSGYGLPLRRARDCTERDLALMTLIRSDERGRGQGVLGFSAVVRSLCASSLPVVFLPGVIHLPTVPAHRKVNRIDLGTADKLCVAALALAQQDAPAETFCLVELGSAFTTCLVLREGQVVDAAGGTSGPMGWASAGAWDGELAYLLGQLSKQDLFLGGVGSNPDASEGRLAFREHLTRAIAGLNAVTPFSHVILSGRLLEIEPAFAQAVEADLARFGTVRRLAPLAGAWIKHAAQGAAVIADGLVGGKYAAVVDRLALRKAGGTVLDWLRHPRAGEVRAAFGLDP